MAGFGAWSRSRSPRYGAGSRHVVGVRSMPRRTWSWPCPFQESRLCGKHTLQIMNLRLERGAIP